MRVANRMELIDNDVKHICHERLFWQAWRRLSATLRCPKFRELDVEGYSSCPIGAFCSQRLWRKLYSFSDTDTWTSQIAYDLTFVENDNISTFPKPVSHYRALQLSNNFPTETRIVSVWLEVILFPSTKMRCHQYERTGLCKHQR